MSGIIPTNILLSLIVASMGGTSAYYTQHFYLPAGMMYGGNNMFYERPPLNRPVAVVPSTQMTFAGWKQPQFYGNMPTLVGARGNEAEEEGEQPERMGNNAGDDKDGEEQLGQQQQQQNKQQQQPEQQQQQHQKVARNQATKIPRRHLRHLLADEFGMGGMGRQFKRMRPCFYSPIQCLMKRSGASASGPDVME